MSHREIRKRIRHYEGEGHARSLTMSCYQRRAYFSRDRACEWFLKAMKLARGRHNVHIWAYVVMPEHVHLLIWPTDKLFRVSDFLSTLKQSVSKRARHHLQQNDPAFIERLGGQFRFWQDGPGYDRNLWSDVYIWETIEYIHQNPVRRGLCSRPDEWYWSSASDYSGCGRGPVTLDQGSLPDDPRR